MKRYTRIGAVAGVVVVLGGDARGFQQGTIGYSGKQSDSCSQCHDDGTVPLVTFAGPSRIAADTVAQFRFIVRSQRPQQAFAGFNVAASDGVLRIAAEEHARVEFNELTHDVPKANDENAEAAWAFDWCVPVGGDFRLFGSGNSVNGNGTRSGDASDETVLEVRVTPPTGDVNCDGRRSAADVTAVFTSVNAGVCESPDSGSGDGTTEVDTTIAFLFVPLCQL